MSHKIILNISDAPIATKILPIIGAAAGIALAKYQKKDCIGCYLGYALTGMIISSTPLIYMSCKKGNELQS